jgi:isopenicillin N synthase-like dioxygenase
MPAPHQILVVDIGPLFQARSTAWELPDQRLFAAARTTGFVCISGLAPDAALGAAGRARLLEIFSLDEAERRCLYRRKFAPEDPNVYRGWFPVQPGNLTAKEGIDLGGDVAHGPSIIVSGALVSLTPGKNCFEMTAASEPYRKKSYHSKPVPRLEARITRP